MSALEGIFNYFGLVVPLWILSLFVGTFIIGIYYDNASRFFPRMKPASIKKSLVVAKKRYIPLLGIQILLSIIFFCVFFVFGGFSIFSILSGNFDVASVLIGVLTGVTALLITSFFLFLTPFACVLDKLDPLKSLKKSFNLVNKNKMDTFAFLILMMIGYYIISFIGTIPKLVYTLLQKSTVYSFNMFPFFLFQLVFSVIAFLFVISSITNFYIILKGKKTKVHKKKTGKKIKKRKK